MLELIFLAVIAAFIVHKLLKTLGREDYNVETYANIKPTIDSLKNKIIQVKNAEFEIISKAEAALPPAVQQTFSEMRKQDANFNAKTFIDRARLAFEMIVTAFNSNDKITLKKLLSDELYKNFVAEIDKRISSGLIHEFTLVGIKEIKILDAAIENKIIWIKIDIESDQIKVIKNKDQNIVSGNVNDILPFYDIWTFSKPMKSNDYWKLIKTAIK
jgi:predicted lipid-binding transport protein (Tim44 family)